MKLKTLIAIGAISLTPACEPKTSEQICNTLSATPLPSPVLAGTGVYNMRIGNVSTPLYFEPQADPQYQNNMARLHQRWQENNCGEDLAPTIEYGESDCATIHSLNPCLGNGTFGSCQRNIQTFNQRVSVCIGTQD
jgi:hypothetical protein